MVKRNDMMESSVGWLLDVTVEGNAAILWIKTVDGKILRLTNTYQPSFYILPKSEIAGAELFHLLSQQPKIRVEWQNKFTDLFDYDKHGIRRLLCVYPESTYHYKTFLNRMQRDQRVAQLFTTDLSYVQLYLFTQLKVEPTCKVQMQYDSASRLIGLTKFDEFSVEPPPFSVLYFELITSLSPYSLDSHDFNDPIRQINVRYQDEAEITFEGSEENLLTDFCRYVLTKDPDILISPKQHYRSGLKYLFTKMSEYRIDTDLGRCKTNECGKRNSFDGRICFDSDSVQNLLEVIEKGRFACLPMGLAARYRISRLIDSRNCYELIKRGFVIPSSTNRQESIRSVEEIFAKDRGGMIFSPQVGLHENVAVLDYENEYANLVVTHNLSYEKAPQDPKGLLPTVVESVLGRRMMFKTLQKSFEVKSKEWLWCEQRIGTLKNIPHTDAPPADLDFVLAMQPVEIR